MIVRVIDRPIPIPCVLVVKNGSNRRARASAVNPGPLSRSDTRIADRPCSVARLVDRLIVCIAPKVIGAGVEAVGDLQIDRMSEALTFARVRVTTVGEDVIFDGQLQPTPR